MKVNVNSWHFRTVCRMNFTPSKSLCVYFWQVVWSTFMLYLVFPALVLFMVIGAIGLSPIPIGDFILWVIDSKISTHGLDSYLTRLGVGYATIAITIGIYLFVKHLRKRSIRQVQKEKSEGIFTSYLKAKKRKVCPIIEFTDGDQDES